MQIKLIPLLIKMFFITKNNKLLLFMTGLATTAIIIATIVCSLTLAIQNAVHTLLHKQLRSSFQDAIITSKEDFFRKAHVAHLNSSSEITHWAPASWRYVLITKQHQTTMQFAVIKFVDPEKEKSFLLHHPIQSNFVQSNHLSHGIIIGSTLQKNLDIAIGDSVDIIFLSKQRKRKKNVLKPIRHSLVVHGTIQTGTSELDATIILCSYNLGKSFMPNLYWDEIAIRFRQNDIFSHDAIISAIQKKFQELQIRSLRELYPTFFASIALEQYVTRLYLMFLLLFVSITLIALFFMQIVHNQKKIIILNFLGMSLKKIYLINFFLIIAQTGIASGIGICIARCIAHLITMYTPKEIQHAYTITNLPVEFSTQLIFIIIAIMIALAIIAGSFTFACLSGYNTLHTLKNETS